VHPHLGRPNGTPAHLAKASKATTEHEDSPGRALKNNA
jgi:hypothetical protein